MRTMEQEKQLLLFLREFMATLNMARHPRSETCVLITLLVDDGPVRIMRLARECKMDPNTIRPQLNRMIERGYVTKQAGGFTITSAGHSEIQERARRFRENMPPTLYRAFGVVLEYGLYLDKTGESPD